MVQMYADARAATRVEEQVEALVAGDVRIPREDFRFLNHVWWWALGFSNLALRPLKQPWRKDVGFNLLVYLIRITRMGASRRSCPIT